MLKPDDVSDIQETLTRYAGIAIANPKLATLLRKVFQEAEHLAYREVTLQEKERDLTF